MMAAAIGMIIVALALLIFCVAVIFIDAVQADPLRPVPDCPALVVDFQPVEVQKKLPAVILNRRQIFDQQVDFRLNQFLRHK